MTSRASQECVRWRPKFPFHWIISVGVVNGIGRNGNVLILPTQTPSSLWLHLRDPDFRFSLDRKLSYVSDYDSDFDSGENPSLQTRNLICAWLDVFSRVMLSKTEAKEKWKQNKRNIFYVKGSSSRNVSLRMVMHTSCSKTLQLWWQVKKLGKGLLHWYRKCDTE